MNVPIFLSATDVVNRWYSEEKKFNYNEEPTKVSGIGKVIIYFMYLITISCDLKLQGEHYHLQRRKMINSYNCKI